MESFTHCCPQSDGAVPRRCLLTKAVFFTQKTLLKLLRSERRNTADGRAVLEDEAEGPIPADDTRRCSSWPRSILRLSLHQMRKSPWVGLAGRADGLGRDRFCMYTSTCLSRTCKVFSRTENER